MSACIIDGKARALSITTEIAERVAARAASGLPQPALAAVLVGDNPASRVYINSKRRTTAALGMRSITRDLPADTPEADLLSFLDSLNSDPTVHGVMVQLPLPTHISEQRVTEAIAPGKDVDGFHPYNIGRL